MQTNDRPGTCGSGDSGRSLEGKTTLTGFSGVGLLKAFIAEQLQLLFHITFMEACDLLFFFSDDQFILALTTEVEQIFNILLITNVL